MLDTQLRVDQKILGALIDGGGGSSGTVLNFVDTPPVAAPGASDPKILLGIGPYIGACWVWDSEGVPANWFPILSVPGMV